jgi:type II secretory pathway predicted ATPase ExeA
MLAAYFGFKGEPFDDPSSSAFVETNLFLRGVAAQLLAGIAERKGLMLVLGDPASGRKLLLRHLIDELRGRCRIVSLASAAAESFDELLVRCCAELGIAERATDRLARARLLVNHFIAQIPEGRNTVLVVDEAHNLDEDGLRNLFLLSELGERKPVQVILAGRNELGSRFAAPDLAAILRGIGLTVRLPALKTADFENYVRTQLQRVGAPDPGLFDGAALERLATLLQDAPELVARLSNQALVITQLEGLRTVTAEAVDQAGHAVFAPPKPDRRPAASVEAPPVTIERPARAVPTSATGDRQRPATATGSASGEPAAPVAIARPAPTAAPRVMEPRPVFVNPANGTKKTTEARVADAVAPPPKRRGAAMLAGAVAVGAALVGSAWLLIEQLGRIDARTGAAPFVAAPRTSSDGEALGRITTAAGSSIGPATSELPINEAPPSAESSAASAPHDDPATAASTSIEPSQPSETETATMASPPKPSVPDLPRAAPTAPSESAPISAAAAATPTVATADAAAAPGLAAPPIATTTETEPQATAAQPPAADAPPTSTAARTAEPPATDPADAAAAPVILVGAPIGGPAGGAAREAALPSPATPAADPVAAPPAIIEPSPPPPAPPPAASRTPPTVADEQLMKRGNALLLTGDFAGARLFFERAAAGGNPRALTAVGKTFDPLFHAEAGFPGSRGEVERATEWYKKAAAAGDVEAATRLRRLQSRR